MIVKAIETERYQDYKSPSMFIAFPSCTFKCEKECGQRVCQNSTLATLPNIFIDDHKLCLMYLSNPITKAITCAGLEPMDSFDELISFIYTLRYEYKCTDDIVIYTGYTQKECESNGWIQELVKFGNIILKVGRYIPNQVSHHDNILGVDLASDNQYAIKL